MTVRQLLRTIDSREITEWMAYEQAHGPLGNAYSNEALAQLHEQLQMANAMKGAELWGDDSPIKKPKPYPRPGQFEEEEVAEEEPSETVESFNRYFD